MTGEASDEVVTDIQRIVSRIVEQLVTRGECLVLAESCTAGRVSSLLGTVPGVSAVLCGGWVTYQTKVKTEWLGVSRQLLEEFTAVAAETSRAMACGALDHCTAADWSLAITGHLGPGVSPDQDGVVYVAVAWRRSNEVQVDSCATRLATVERTDRQLEAAQFAIRALDRRLQTAS